MSFHPDKVQDFLAWFDLHKNKIATFEGCLHLELWRDAQHANIFYTYSIWLDETCIEKYRNSELFNEVWAYTKQLFNDKPHAFSATLEITVNTKNN